MILIVRYLWNKNIDALRFHDYNNLMNAMRFLGGHLMNERERLIHLKEETGLNWKDFSAYFEIPYRTIQDWEHGRRQMPPYLLRLMEYKIKTEQLYRNKTLSEEKKTKLVFRS